MDQMIIKAKLGDSENVQVKSDLSDNTNCLNNTVQMVQSLGGKVTSTQEEKEFDPNNKNPAFVNLT